MGSREVHEGLRPIMGACIEHTQKCAAYGFGYGRARLHGKNTTLHRKVFWDTYGYLPEVVRHACDNLRCINPEHLVPGTQRDNMQDRLLRGRWQGGRPSRITPEQLADILTSTDTQKAIAQRVGISQSRISNLRKQHND